MKLAVVAALLGCSFAALQARASEGRPDLSHLLGRARLVVVAHVADVASYDSGRFTVARLVAGKALKGVPGDGPILVVERHDLPSSPQVLQAGHHVLAFLNPARRNSSLEKALPPATYYEIVSRPAGVIASPTAAGIEEPSAILSRLIAMHRKPEKDAERRAAAARALVFDEIAARHAVLVADGIRGLGHIGDLAGTLTAEERLRLEAALKRRDLPTWIRVALVDAIAERGLTALIPALRDLAEPGPDLQRAAWNALKRLGAPPSADDLRSALAAPDPATRSAAVGALAAAEGANARPQLERLAMKDPSSDVRIAAIEALGDTGTGALPTLERSFARDDWAERHAAGRAISKIGGRAAQESFARLAFEGPPDAQKLAVTLLLLSGIPHDDPLVQRIARKHPDEGVRHIVDEGLDLHEH